MWLRPFIIGSILLCSSCSERNEPSMLTRDSVTGTNTEFECLTLHNAFVSVSTIPALGGKITSLRRIDGREFLSRSDRAYQKRQYGMNYGDTEFDGIDECFPSLSASTYPAEPWQAVHIPDHGEICQLEWQVTAADDQQITCRINGKALPYIFERSIRLRGTEIVLDYQLHNTSDQILHWMYAFHPLFHGETGCALAFPDTTPIRVALSSGKHLGPADKTYKWSEFKNAEQTLFKDQQYQSGSKRYYKYYAGPLDTGAVDLHYTDGSQLQITWPAALFPYAAVWCSQGAVGGLEHIAAEPTNTIHDALLDAHQAGQTHSLAAHARIEWRITFKLK